MLAHQGSLFKHPDTRNPSSSDKETDILLNSSSGFDARTLRKLTDIVEQHQDLIKEAWHEYFG